MKTALLPPTPGKWLLTGALVAVALGLLLFHRQLTRRFATDLFLKSKNPREEFFSDLAMQSADTSRFLERSWATGRISQRQLVASFLHEAARTNPPWFHAVEKLVVAGATDADVSVRELALAALETRRDSRLFDCARAQLEDLDPMIRLLGIQYLRKNEPQTAVPVVMRLVEDSDLRVAAAAESALMRWSGQDFGVRMWLAVPAQEGAHAGEVDSANVEIVHRGIERRKQWWQLHEKDFPAALPPLDHSEAAEPGRLPTADFKLEDLRGRRIRLSDFRGKVVLVNFWASWCPACLAEIPELIALQKKNGKQIVILGVALDGVPDEHGHEPDDEGHDGSHPQSLGLKAVREKVTRAVNLRGINYPVLLDPNNFVGGQFNGGELPTTVIIDAEGRVRRRFIGERSLPVFQAMIAEAVAPPNSHARHIE